MTALTIPPEVAAECSQRLLDLAATANRDAMTLTKQALVLARNETPSRAFATLNAGGGEAACPSSRAMGSSRPSRTYR